MESIFFKGLYPNFFKGCKMKNLLIKLVLLVLMSQMAFSAKLLKSDESIYIEVTQGLELYYMIDTYGAETIDVDIFNLTGDVDLYVKKGSAPTQSDYDCRPYKGGIKSESCSDMSISSTDEVYIMVNGYASGTSEFRLNASLASVKSALPKSSSVSQGSWKYYPINLRNSGITNGRSYTLDVTLTGLDHDVDLFIKKDAKPTGNDYDCRPYKEGTTSETCNINISIYDNYDSTVVIGVYGYESGNFTLKATLKNADGYPVARKNHFIGNWEMVNDGWKGELKLYYDSNRGIEFGRKYLVGEYIASNGNVAKVQGNFMMGKQNGVTFKIYSSNGETQEYELYLFTHKTEDMAEMAGITHWNGMPFGVSLYKKEKAYFDGVREGSLVSPYISGTYKMSHDGHQGEITFTDLGNGSLTGSYIGPDGNTYAVTGTYSASGSFSPHIVTFVIHSDYDQEFNVYLFTQTKEGMAGITHWNNIPFGVRLTHSHQ